MRSFVNRIESIGGILILVSLSACALANELQAQKSALSRASYEQIRPAIESIQVGDEMSKVLEIARPKDNKGGIFRLSQRFGSRVEYFIFPMWPGVLTPFFLAEYMDMSLNEANGRGISLSTRSMPFGYLDGMMLRPRRILIFEDQKVSKIIEIPDIEESLKEPGVTVAKAEPLDHLRKQAYEQLFLPKKDRITPGMGFWEVFTLLNSSFVMTSDAQSFAIICPGYLNYKRSIEAEKTPEGVRAIYPFGYVDGDTEIVKWEVEMLNDSVVGVRAREE